MLTAFNMIIMCKLWKNDEYKKTKIMKAIQGIDINTIYTPNKTNPKLLLEKSMSKVW